MFKEPFSFEGRIRRTELGISYIIYAVIAVIINLIIEANGDDASFVVIFYLPLLWFLWAQNAKRCHDVGNSGWWQLIPLYGFWLLFQDGQFGPNQYGENPKGIQGNSGQGQQTRQTYQGTGSSSTYKGGYSGGHNNPNQNYNSPSNTGNLENNENNESQDGYKDGNLYN